MRRVSSIKRSERVVSIDQGGEKTSTAALEWKNIFQEQGKGRNSCISNIDILSLHFGANKKPRDKFNIYSCNQQKLKTFNIFPKLHGAAYRKNPALQPLSRQLTVSSSYGTSDLPRSHQREVTQAQTSGLDQGHESAREVWVDFNRDPGSSELDHTWVWDHGSTAFPGLQACRVVDQYQDLAMLGEEGSLATNRLTKVSAVAVTRHCEEKAQITRDWPIGADDKVLHAWEEKFSVNISFEF
ncbi:hypothetical protein RRG08_057387 [Elysia crispata]|uniref:Uncharacterized protein n=1 Tax=Elysia crispata TaxID=231223 RepID=A0AAE1AZX8_9GAST|nr:hypothetical protein RRG08_057387 [Elysia crispata]